MVCGYSSDLRRYFFNFISDSVSQHRRSAQAAKALFPRAQSCSYSLFSGQ